MSILVVLAFGSLMALAAAFACWPILRGRRIRPASRVLLAASVLSLLLAIGGGLYLILGSPHLAARSVAAPVATDLRGLVAELAWRVRERPNDALGWTLLGRGYLTLNDPADAAAAFRRALIIAAPQQRPMLYSAYGESLARAAGGTVGPEAEDAFTKAVQANPKDFAARFYLGEAYAARHDTRRALALWERLLSDAPLNAPWRAELVDRIALLKAQNGANAPDVGAMVSRLDARLRNHPNDPEGWQRLIRAYAVLGDTRRALTALTDARNALKTNSAALAQLSAESRELNLQK